MLQPYHLYSQTTPVPFLTWLESKEKISPDFKENYVKYQEYIREWVKINKDKKDTDKNIFNSLYIDLLKEITLNFTTEEEKRFLINFDYTKYENLDIVIPFFIDKLKGICLYYSSKREKLRETVSLYPYKGTNFHIQKITKGILLDNLKTGFVQKENENFASFPSLSSIVNNLDVRVEEIYDSENYFDKPVKSLSANFGNIEIDYKLYLDFKGAIVDAIKEYPLYLKKLEGNFTVNLDLSGGEYEYLKERDFINYFNTLSSEDLKLNIKKFLSPKYTSSNYYYLSVGNTSNSYVSGVLFYTSPLTGSKIENLTNRENSTIATVQSLENLYTSYEMGKFFTPTKLGILQYSSFDKQYILDKNKLSPNSVFVFPDPNIVEKNENSPFIFKVDVSWNKLNKSSGFKFGEVISQSYYQRFYPYESITQDLNVQPFGLSLSVDNLDYWNGERDTFWTEKDLWPGLQDVEKLPLDERLESLLIDKGDCTSWYTDIYGNEFGLFKNLDKDTTLYDKKKILPGNLYVKNSVTNLVSSFNHFFNIIIKKYPENIESELNSSIYYFYVYNNVILVETKSFVVLESYEFDLATGQFISNLLPGIFIPKATNNDRLEKYVGNFYVEKDDSLYLCFLKLADALSGSNYKSLYPVIYQTSTKKIDLKQLYPDKVFNATVYSLSSNQYKVFPEIDLKYVEGAKISYKEKYNIFNLSYYAYNYNDIPYIVNEQFSVENSTGKLVSLEPILSKPYYYVHDTNFSNPSIDTKFRFSATYSEDIGLKDETTFRWNVINSKYDNFYFCSKVNPVFINIPGSHYVQFDWNQYPYGNMFIGCENFQVTLIDGINFVNFKDKSIEISEEDKWYRITDEIFNGLTFTISAYKPLNSNGSLLNFYVTSSTTPITGRFILCNNLYSLYNNVRINVIGDGRGVITSDPFCVECFSLSSFELSGNVCEFAFPKNNTITLIPSAFDGSTFGGWRGGTCDGVAGNCLLTVTNTTNLTAIFNKIPIYTLSVTSNLSDTRIVTLDGLIDCYNSTCSAEYVNGTLVGVSAGPPSSKGYIFSRFRGIELSENNPIGVSMTKNYSLTAVYLSAENVIELYNAAPNKSFGPIVGSTGGNPPMEFNLLTDSNNTIFYLSGDNYDSTLICSLSPEERVSGYGRFVGASNEFVFVSAVDGVGEFKFKEYKGNPCENKDRVCFFNLAQNYSISGYFDRPYYTITIFNTGAALFYTESNDGNLNAGTLSLKNTRNKTSFTYVSGTVIELSGVSIKGSGMLYMSAGKHGVRTGDEENGSDFLKFILPITESVTVTSACMQGEDGFRNLTMVKEGNGNFINSVVFFTVVGDNINGSVQSGVLKQEFINKIPYLSEIELYPTFIPSGMAHLYTYGYSAMFMDISVTSPLTIAPDPSLIYEYTPVIGSDLLNVNGSTGYIAPNLNNFYSNLYTLINPKIIVTMEKSLTARFVFATNPPAP